MEADETIMIFAAASISEVTDISGRVWAWMW